MKGWSFCLVFLVVVSSDGFIVVNISFSSNSLRPSLLEFEEFVVVGSVVSSKKVVVTVKKKENYYQEYSSTFERYGMPSQITPILLLK